MDNYDTMKTRLRKILFGETQTWSELGNVKKAEIEEFKKEANKIVIPHEI
jgi:hypothetical protein